MTPAHIFLQRLAALRRPLLSAVLCAATLAAFAPHALAQGEPRVRTDRVRYFEPTLPALPAVGGIYRDAVFGTEIMRVTGAGDHAAPGCGTWYSQWPTFNADQTRVLIRCGTSGDMRIKAFYPNTFTLGSTVVSTTPTLAGGVTLEWQGATWSRTDPDLIYVHVNNYSPDYSATGMKLYEYRLSTNGFTLLKDFAPQLAPGQPDFLFEMHVDANDEVFTFMHKRQGAGGDPIAFIVWKRSTDTILKHITNDLTTFGPKEKANAAIPDKSGRWIAFPFNDTQGIASGDPRLKVLDLQNDTWQTIYYGQHDTPGHGDLGSGFMVGRGSDSGAMNKRSLSDIQSYTQLFNFRDDSNERDWTDDQHTTLAADDETWATVGTINQPEGLGANERHTYENEILRFSTTDAQKFRRLLHTRSEGSGTDYETNGYWAGPFATITRDGRYIAYTSNWEDSGRTDMFVALAPNIDETTFFVRQHYRDFLGRAGDSNGVGFWHGEIEQCGTNAVCREVKRINVSAAFFLSIEFQQTGYLAYRAWGAAFGPTRIEGRWALTRAEFLPDVSILNQNLVVGATGWEAQLEANKVAYFDAFVARTAFTTAYPTSMTPTQYVDALNATSGYHLSLSERNQLISDLTNQTKTRAEVLRAVAEDSDFVYWQNNRAFVVMEYFGYLRRDPDTLGYDHWYNKLNQFNGDYVAAEMVKGFTESLEYRDRFGQ